MGSASVFFLEISFSNYFGPESLRILTISNIKNIFPNRSITPLPCPKCVDVIFCSKKCRNASIYSYHKFECGLLETFWSSGSSINYQMAMRLVSQRPMSYYKSIRDDLKDSLSLEELKQ